MKRRVTWIFLAVVIFCVACSTSSDSELAALGDVTSLADIPTTSDTTSHEVSKPDVDPGLEAGAETIDALLEEDVQDLGPELDATPELLEEIPEPTEIELNDTAEPEPGPESTPEVDLEPQPEVMAEIEPEGEIDAEVNAEPEGEVETEVEAEPELIEETSSDLGPDTDTDTGPEVSSCADDPTICDDDNPCTQTWCGQGAVCTSVCNCAWTCASDADCDNGDACIATTCQTVGDGQCGGSECVWEAVICEEPDDPCYTAACESLLGCVDVPDDWADCDDGDPYTTDDHCLNGSCYGSCEPDCSNGPGGPAACGPDGCGGSCGDCPDYHDCEAGACEAVCPPLCGSLPSCDAPVPYDGHGYYYCKKDRTYNEALQFCANHDAHLVTIKNEAENDAVADLASGALRVWIGLDDKGTEGSFLWTTGEPLDYENWAFSEPNNGWPLGNQDCALMTPGNGKWRDDDCNDKAATVCEFE